MASSSLILLEPLSQATAYFDETSQFSLVIAQGCRVFAPPKPTAVFSHHPVLIRSATRGAGSLQFPLGFAGLPVFFTEEDPHMLANGLFHRIACKAFAIFIPSGNLALS